VNVKGTVGHEDSPLDLALDFVAREIRSGLGHGFFEIHLQSEIVQGKKRRLVLKAGKTYIFVISEEELKH
jgi:hypothetical protein